MLKTKFRRTRCIVHQGTEFERVADTVITEDGIMHIIQKMKDGTEYFTINNPYTVAPTSSLAKNFIGCIGDAVRAIREDYADVLIGGNGRDIFSSGNYPAVLLDREKGEEYRAKSKEGWKDTKFGWAIKFGYNDSFGGYRYASETGRAVNSIEDVLKVYDTKEEAEAQFKKWHAEALEYAKKYVEVFEDEKKRQELLDEIFDKHNFDIVDMLFSDMVCEVGEDRVCLVDDPMHLEHVGWKIVQAVKH